MHPATLALLLIAGNEAVHASVRHRSRRDAFARARSLAQALRAPLVVVGSPSTGLHTRLAPAYGCGDLCIDLVGCEGCSHSAAVDLDVDAIPMEDHSAVVFVSCTLEYVRDPMRAWNEIKRVAIAPAAIELVVVGAGCLTSVSYPGARWIVERVDDETIAVRPVTVAHDVVARLGLLALIGSSMRG